MESDNTQQIIMNATENSCWKVTSQSRRATKRLENSIILELNVGNRVLNIMANINRDILKKGKL